MEIAIKRAYADYDPNDGERILVDRLWPRGVKKEDAHVDAWEKGVAPSDDLRKTFHQNPNHFDRFKSAYKQELNQNRDAHEACQRLCRKAADHKISLIYSSKNESENNAVVLREHLLAMRVY
ncbi:MULTISPECIES: DUF488 domain-containing protein [Aerococcus]|uniref:DUF488 family protein n=1 Tax=Aerococcus tenax TaxID=3078812 RepID=A0A5N1BUF0_9LACT|nr:DUF488 family protein [Aerococcus urinae]KAA9242012.1 DUF488 family protein [Aerococcus urinae]MDK7303063.1 DUF488 family protein [Aerococcus urinae]MDK7801345.1 DUF488 family protein [Aerococcus urinae]MDK8655115.1 DUF488 family protein [Aerococcus urinae]RAV70906.1 hypothetical protein DBT40_06810 [Aerococcus urinae]